MTGLSTITEIAMGQHKMFNLELVIDLPFLAREINDAHRRVQFHGKSMLMEAKRAGEALLEVKRREPHGTFAKWVNANCECSYESAMKYMRIAKRAAKIGTHSKFDPSKGINAFLAATLEDAEEPATPRSFTREDAERALKFHALATRGATEGEQAAASSKLASFAKEFGMTPEAAVARAREFLPDHEKTAFERNAESIRRENAEKEERARAAERRADELEKTVERLVKRREELFKDFRSKSKEELVDLLIAARLQLEGFGA